MTSWSLRTRLIALSAAATLVALALAGWVMAGMLGRFVTAGVDQRLDAELAVLARGVRADGTIDRVLLTQRLGVLDAGPDWRWRIAGPKQTIASADFPTLAPPPRGPPAPPGAPQPPMPLPLALPAPPIALDGNDRHGDVHARQAVMQTDGGPVILTAAAPSRVIAEPIRAAMVPLLTVIATLAVIFAIAAWLQLRASLRPITALRDQIAAIRRGNREMVDVNQPVELKPLAEELNALAADRAAALNAARGSAANLAHALKTPVATLALSVAEDEAATVQVRKIEAVIRHHLVRARTAAVNRRAATDLASVVDDVVAVTRRLHPEIAIVVDAAADLAVSVDRHDLVEIAGNLTENAARHARHRIHVAAQRNDQGRVCLLVNDDGPGIPEDQRHLAVQAGVRLDETARGDGFGLAIVRELADLYGARLTLGEGVSGGLAVTVIFRSAVA